MKHYYDPSDLHRIKEKNEIFFQLIDEKESLSEFIGSLSTIDNAALLATNLLKSPLIPLKCNGGDVIGR